MTKYILPRTSDRRSFVYIEKAKIHKKDSSVVVEKEDKEYNLHIATILTLIIGVGVSITSDAVKLISEYGCSICYVSFNMVHFNTFGVPLTNSSNNLQVQVKYFSSLTLKNEVIHKLYSLRYPNEHLKTKNVKELMGIEGQKMSNLYQELTSRYDVKWSKRTYHLDNFNDHDDINKTIIVANQVVYCVISAIVNSLGFNTALGFVHNGQMFSFVYDLADLYKECIILPLCFDLYARIKCFNRQVLFEELHNKFDETKLLSNVIDVIFYLFDIGKNKNDIFNLEKI